MTTGSILVVEDTRDELALLIRYLSAQGYQMLAATSGEEAVPHLDRSDLDLVITDFNMPGMNGLDLARRSLAANPDRPVILMTAYADVDNARQSVTLGVYDFIIKPFDLKDFQNAVRRALNHRRLVLQNQVYQRSLERMVEERTRELREAMKKLHRKVKELEGHGRINRLLLTIHPLEETLSVVLEGVQSALGLERVVIFLPDASGQKLEPAAGTGVRAPEDFASPETLRGVSDAWIKEAGIAVAQAFREGRVVEQKLPPGGVAIPMLRLGEVVGVIFAQNPFSGKPLSEEDLQILAGLTAQAAVAVSDARLYGDSEQWQTVIENLENLRVEKNP